jgi:hypothetical protein
MNKTNNFLCVSSPSCVYQIKEGGEGQSTQLMLNDVIFAKQHVSAERGHLHVSHLYRGNVEVIMNRVGSSGTDLYFLSTISMCVEISTRTPHTIHNYFYISSIKL